MAVENVEENLKPAIKKESYFAKFLLYTLYPEDYSEWEVEQFKKEFEGFDIKMVYGTHIWQKIASIFNL